MSTPIGCYLWIKFRRDFADGMTLYSNTGEILPTARRFEAALAGIRRLTAVYGQVIGGILPIA